MRSAAYAVGRCLAGCLSVMFVYFVETAEQILKIFHLLVAPSCCIFITKYCDEIPTMYYILFLYRTLSSLLLVSADSSVMS